jgi:DNA-directed RNA polymerase alpha subunit
VIREVEITDSLLLEKLELFLSVRATSAIRTLIEEGLRTVTDLRAITDYRLLRLPNCGRGTIAEIRGLVGKFEPPIAVAPLKVSEITDDTPLERLKPLLSVRARNVLHTMIMERELQTVRDLRHLSEVVILRHRNCGRKTAREFRALLAGHPLDRQHRKRKGRRRTTHLRYRMSAMLKEQRT